MFSYLSFVSAECSEALSPLSFSSSLSLSVRSPLMRRDILLLPTPSALCAASVVWRAGGCCHRWKTLQLQHPRAAPTVKKEGGCWCCYSNMWFQSPHPSSSSPPPPADARLGETSGGFNFFINHPPLLQWVHPSHQRLSLQGTETIQAQENTKQRMAKIHPPSRPLESLWEPLNLMWTLGCLRGSICLLTRLP